MKYLDRIKRLREKKLEQTRQKMSTLGPQDEDDYGNVPPPENFKWVPPVKDSNGCFYGAKAWGRNFRSLMENHPVYIDPDDVLAGRWMFMLSRMRAGYKLSLAPFPVDYSHFHREQALYDITSGIGKDAHFAPDYNIGLSLGWNGLKAKVQKSLKKYPNNQESVELLNAELDAIAGIQDWIRRTAAEALQMSEIEKDCEKKENLRTIASINHKLAEEAPTSLREACQWLAWFNMASRTYNRDGAGGQLDGLLLRYYEKDLAEGKIDDEDAVFFIACLLLNDPHYYQLGGPDRNGNDQTSGLSFLILEAAHLLKISCNITIRVHDGMDEKLFRRGMEILFEDKLGYPRFSGDSALVAGFVKNGFDTELARERIAVGCSWMSLPGREYTLNDLVKINMAKTMEVAFNEVSASGEPSVSALMMCFEKHLRKAVRCTAAGINFHLEHQYKNEPELLLNLLSHGPIEKGRDVSHGGAEFYNMCLDGAGLAVVADSFAAIEQRIEKEKILSWTELKNALSSNFAGLPGERIRSLLKNSERFGSGHSPGDKYAKKITKLFTDIVKSEPMPGNRILIPGFFSWADTVRFGKTVGATANGRLAGTPISHGANPNPGFRKDGALTAIAKAVADVQPGYGNTAPLQLEIDIGSLPKEKNLDIIGGLLKTHFALGGTLININIIDAEKIRDAHENPEKYPDLTVRVTGFSAYFASLSKEFRQLVVDRIIGAV